MGECLVLFALRWRSRHRADWANDRLTEWRTDRLTVRQMCGLCGAVAAAPRWFCYLFFIISLRWCGCFYMYSRFFFGFIIISNSGSHSVKREMHLWRRRDSVCSIWAANLSSFSTQKQCQHFHMLRKTNSLNKCKYDLIRSDLFMYLRYSWSLARKLVFKI